MDVAAKAVIISKPRTMLPDDQTPSTGKEFTFDAVFPPGVSQEDIYDSTGRDIVDRVLEGFNGTVFAYGQTGAGKTYTMVGSGTGPDRGIIPRVFEHIFKKIESSADGVKFLIQASFLEIYNEDIRDLLLVGGGKQGVPTPRLDLMDKPDGSVGVKGLSSIVVKDMGELQALLATGLGNRSVGSTLMNSESSRSHSIFTVVIESSGEGGHVKVGKLNLVDLAGSERQSKTGAVGDTLKEAAKINLSLSALGNVISALVDSKNLNGFIPYRDSKLTRLLQDSLGGNTKTVMISTVGPVDYNYDESLSTLRYASRAKNIKNKPRVNEDPKDALIRGFQEEIDRLREELARRDGATVTTAVPQQQPNADLVQKLQGLETRIIHGHEMLAQAAEKDVELNRTRANEIRIQEKYNEQSAERQNLEEQCKYQIGQADELRRKLEKAKARYQRSREDLADVESEFQQERESLLSTIREMHKIANFNDIVIKARVPKQDLERIEVTAWFSEETGQWVVDPSMCDDYTLLRIPYSKPIFDLHLDTHPFDPLAEITKSVYFTYSDSGEVKRDFNPQDALGLPASEGGRTAVRPLTADKHGRPNSASPGRPVSSASRHRLFTSPESGNTRPISAAGSQRLFTSPELSRPGSSSGFPRPDSASGFPRPVSSSGNVRPTTAGSQFPKARGLVKQDVL